MIIETYIDEVNKEEYYIDSNTIENLNIRKSQIDMRNYGKKKVGLNVKYVPLKKEMKIISSINVDGKNYSGESEPVSSLVFSNTLAQAIMKDEIIEGTPLIMNMMDQALLNLSVSLMSNEIAVKNRVFSGVGYVMSKNKKIAVFEKLTINDGGSESGVESILISECVNSFDLALAESCSLKFCSNNFAISADIRTVTRTNSQKISSYNFSVFNLKISQASKPVENLETIENDIDRLIKNRLSLLDDIINNLNVDELFEDIF